MNLKAKSFEFSPDWEGGTGDVKRFYELACRYQEIGAMHGIKIRTFKSPDLPLFHAASPEVRKRATDFLESILSIHEEAIAAKEVPVNSRQLIWRALRKLSLVPGRDVFDSLTDDDVVVMYDGAHKVIFWNLQFFKFISYSIEELFFRSWTEFTRREPEIQQKLIEFATDIVTGKITGTFKIDVSKHRVEEIDSAERVITMMEFPFGSVLTKNGQFGGMLIVQRMEIVGYGA